MKSGAPVGCGAVAGGKKNARRRKAWLVFQDESGVSERPSVRRTWAPRGQTPTLIHAFNWGKISVAAALAYRWDGKRGRLYFQMRPGSYGPESLVAFLQELRRHLPASESSWCGTDYLPTRAGS